MGKSKFTFPPDGKFLKKNEWKEVLIFPSTQKDCCYHLDGYGYFDYYISFLAKKAEFKKRKQCLEMENVFMFINAFPDIENLNDDSIPKTLYRKYTLPLDAEVNKNCKRYKTIVIHKEALNYWDDWIWVYQCNITNNSVNYNEIYNNQFFTVINWQWYNVVFRNYKEIKSRQ